QRFLYDSLSLCEHSTTVITLTVIISCIFSLDSTDGQSKITARSTATESRWSSSIKAVYIINQEFRSFSRFLWSHSEALSVSAAALFSADLWRLSRTALPAQLLLSTGGAGELDTGRVRGHRGGSDQRREPAGRPLQPQ
ncbi:hypothetical protein PO909_021140, partial [Leuciscus waleckii]